MTEAPNLGFYIEIFFSKWARPLTAAYIFPLTGCCLLWKALRLKISTVIQPRLQCVFNIRLGSFDFFIGSSTNYSEYVLCIKTMLIHLLVTLTNSLFLLESFKDDWLTDWLIDWFNNWLTDRLIYLLFVICMIAEVKELSCSKAEHAAKVTMTVDQEQRWAWVKDEWWWFHDHVTLAKGERMHSQLEAIKGNSAWINRTQLNRICEFLNEWKLWRRLWCLLQPCESHVLTVCFVWFKVCCLPPKLTTYYFHQPTLI